MAAYACANSALLALTKAEIMRLERAKEEDMVERQEVVAKLTWWVKRTTQVEEEGPQEAVVQEEGDQVAAIVVRIDKEEAVGKEAVITIL